MWNCLFSRGLPLILLLLLLLLTKTPPIHPDMFNLLLPLPSNTDLTSNPSSSYLLNFPIIICSPSQVITCISSAFSSASTDPPIPEYVFICLHPLHPHCYSPVLIGGLLAPNLCLQSPSRILSWWVIGAKANLPQTKQRSCYPSSCQQKINCGE